MSNVSEQLKGRAADIKTAASLNAFAIGVLTEIANGERELEPVSMPEANAALFRSINVMTHQVFYDQNVGNFKVNEERLKSGPGIIGHMQGIYKGGPAIIAGAGPSLNLNIDQVARAHREGIPVFAVDAAYPILRNAGVDPDWVVLIDSKPIQGEFFKGWSDTNATLLAIACAHEDAVAAWPGEVRYFNSLGTEEDEAIQMRYGRDFGSVAVGGNVATATLGLAFIITEADPIVLVGHDYSFPDMGRYYADGGVVKLVPDNKRVLPLWDIYGRTVQTDLSLWSYCVWTLELLDDLRNKYGLGTRFINATEGGILGVTETPGELRDELEYARLVDVVDELLNTMTPDAVGSELQCAGVSDGAIVADVVNGAA